MPTFHLTISSLLNCGTADADQNEEKSEQDWSYYSSAWEWRESLNKISMRHLRQNHECEPQGGPRRKVWGISKDIKTPPLGTMAVHQDQVEIQNKTDGLIKQYTVTIEDQKLQSDTEKLWMVSNVTYIVHYTILLLGRNNNTKGKCKIFPAVSRKIFLHHPPPGGWMIIQIKGDIMTP